MEIRTCGPFAEVQINETLRITRDWQKISRAKAKPLIGSEYKGRPLYETRETPRRIKPVVEVMQRPSEEGEQEDDS